MSSPACSAGQPARASARRSALVETWSNDRSRLATSRIGEAEPPPLLDRAQRLALEVDEHEAVRASGGSGRGGGRRGSGSAAADGAVRSSAASRSRIAGAQAGAPSRRSSSWPSRPSAVVEVGASPSRRQARRSSAVGLARREGVQLAGVGQRRVELGQGGPELRGVLGRELEGDRAWRGDPVGQPLGRRLVGVLGVRDQLLEHRHAWPRTVRADVLGRAAQRRDDPRAPLLGQERVSSRSGFRPGTTRRKALSRSRSPRTAEVFDWSAPSDRSSQAPISPAPRARTPAAPGRAGRRAHRRPRSG